MITNIKIFHKAKQRALEVIARYKLDRYFNFFHHPQLWKLREKSLARGAAVGAASTFIPVPFQTVIMLLVCLRVRANIPVAIAVLFVLCPFPVPPQLYLAYKLGEKITQFMLEQHKISTIIINYFLGFMICVPVTVVLMYFLGKLGWKLYFRIGKMMRKRKKRKPSP